MKFLCCAVLGIATLGFVGCGGGPDNNVVIDTNYQPAQAIKDGLEGIKTSGRIGSNFSGMMMSLNDLRKVDATKADMLEKELKDLSALKDAAKIKAKAAEIISKI